MKVQQNGIIERFQQSAPVDVTALAEALGLRVWEDDFLPEGISGKLFQDPIQGGPEGYSITVRSSDPYVRKRFTVAHEIAHFVLHRNRIGSLVTDDAFYRSNLSNREEAEANRFAADILMPRPLLAKYITMYGSDPAFLAEMFKVSEAAMRIRLGLPTS
jgi:Zn-dependent peptidase ImmA (M78 family)